MDRWEERVTGCGTAVAGVLELSKVYFEHFNKIEIAGSKIRRNNASLISDNRPSNLRGSAQRRIARVSTAFALSAALVEIDDLTNHKHQKSLIIERVLDTFFRGRDRDIDDCLDAMTELSLVEKHDDNIMEKKRHYRKFTPKYVEFLKDYTESVVTTVTGMETVLGQKWRQTARIVFDFYRFRYIPEWYLLIRRILRSSARHRNKIPRTSVPSKHTYQQYLVFSISYRAKSLSILLRLSVRPIVMCTLPRSGTARSYTTDTGILVESASIALT